MGEAHENMLPVAIALLHSQDIICIDACDSVLVLAPSSEAHRCDVGAY